jgi:hypothetical protein
LFSKTGKRVLDWSSFLPNVFELELVALDQSATLASLASAQDYPSLRKVSIQYSPSSAPPADQRIPESALPAGFARFPRLSHLSIYGQFASSHKLRWEQDFWVTLADLPFESPRTFNLQVSFLNALPEPDSLGQLWIQVGYWHVDQNFHVSADAEFLVWHYHPGKGRHDQSIVLPMVLFKQSLS